MPATLSSSLSNSSSSTLVLCLDSCSWMSMSSDFALPFRRKHALKNSSN